MTDARPDVRSNRLRDDQGFRRSARWSVWGTVLAYPLGALVMPAIYGSSEAGLAWIFLYWENLYWLEWAWLAPALILLLLLRRWRAAIGVMAGGILVAAAHGSVLFYLLSRGVR